MCACVVTQQRNICTGVLAFMIQFATNCLEDLPPQHIYMFSSFAIFYSVAILP